MVHAERKLKVIPEICLARVTTDVEDVDFLVVELDHKLGGNK